jgi:hypothetical protein
VGSADPANVSRCPLCPSHHQSMYSANKHKVKHIYMLVLCRFDLKASMEGHKDPWAHKLEEEMCNLHGTASTAFEEPPEPLDALSVESKGRPMP